MPPNKNVPTTTLAKQVEVPMVGFGTYLIEPADTERAVLQALRAGYRHIDTAEMYANEDAPLRSGDLLTAL